VIHEPAGVLRDRPSRQLPPALVIALLDRAGVALAEVSRREPARHM
jgi:hypothetical protein